MVRKWINNNKKKFPKNLNKKSVLVDKLNYNEKCSDSSLCNDLVGLNCSSGLCSCSENQYFNGKICSNLKYYNIWKKKLNYFNLVKAQTLSNGAECKLNSECDLKKGLACIKNSCQCLNSSLYWNNKLCGTFIYIL